MARIQDLSPIAQAVLLLCGPRGPEGAEPLAPGLYNKLAGWLAQRDLNPALLMEAQTLVRYQSEPLPELGADRLRTLMQRGLGIALLVEEWQRQGGWVLCRADGAYPRRLREVLKANAPPLLYGIGAPQILISSGLGIVGSRGLDQEGRDFAFGLGRACALSKLAVFSGGARGADEAGAQGAFEHGGVVGLVLAGDLGRTALAKTWRTRIGQGLAALCSPMPPAARFTAGAAMGRNKLIYALSRATVVVASAKGSGGTWAGATENLRRWHVPLFVRDAPHLAGNPALIAAGARPFPPGGLENPRELLEEEQVGPPDPCPPSPEQLGLFGMGEPEARLG